MEIGMNVDKPFFAWVMLREVEIRLVHSSGAENHQDME